MNKKIILIMIIFLAAILRLINLSQYPSGLNADEAALGYNAYSLLLTGKDEHGHVWPVNLESFGDFKPAAYAYVLIPFIKVLGLNEFAVRFPSAILGILCVYLIYRLANQTIGHGLFTAFFLAISPWHIHFSRGAWEVNMATTSLVFAVSLFISWVNQPKKIYLTLSGLGFLLSMYTYQSARLIAPVLVIALFLLYFKYITKHLTAIIIPLFVVIIASVPLIYSVFSSNSSSRLAGVGIFADIGPINRVNQLRGQHASSNSLVAKVLHNRPFVYTLQFVYNYLDHFEGNFLFINGDQIERSRVPEFGQLYPTDLLFIALGIYILIKKPTKHSKVIFVWLLIAPLAASITFQTPHALRSHNMVIPLILIISSGADFIYKKLSAKLIFSAILLIYTFQTTLFLHEYFVHYPQVYPSAWEYGFSQTVSYVESVKDNYDQVVMTDKYDQPYILFLFYMKYPPDKFQNHHILTVRDRFNFSTVRSFDKYKFISTSPENLIGIKNALVISTPSEVPENSNPLKTIYFPNQQPAFKIVSYNK